MAAVRDEHRFDHTLLLRCHSDLLFGFTIVPGIMIRRLVVRADRGHSDDATVPGNSRSLRSPKQRNGQGAGQGLHRMPLGRHANRLLPHCWRKERRTNLSIAIATRLSRSPKPVTYGMFHALFGKPQLPSFPLRVIWNGRKSFITVDKIPINSLGPFSADLLIDHNRYADT